MAKTAETLRLEESIYKATKKQGTFGCFEVTIGWFGKERVDYLTYDTKGDWRCYEIKVSLADFHSSAAKTFVGNFNYFVMPASLFDTVMHRGDIPDGIGVYVDGICVKRAKRRTLGVDEKILTDSMIRSLSREYQATRSSQDRDYLARLKWEADYAKRQAETANRERLELFHALMEVYGRDGWLKIRDHINRKEVEDA